MEGDGGKPWVSGFDHPNFLAGRKAVKTGTNSNHHKWNFTIRFDTISVYALYIHFMRFLSFPDLCICFICYSTSFNMQESGCGLLIFTLEDPSLHN